MLPLSVTFISCGILIIVSRFFGFGIDESLGVQKFHISITSRLGGIALFIGFVSSLLLIPSSTNSTTLFIKFLISSIPIFVAGTLEDITHKISPSIRMILALFSSTLAYLFLEVKVIRTDVWVVDLLLQWGIFVYFITVIVIAGFTHAINIIDGFNGLASGQSILILGFLSILNYSTHQFDLLIISITLMSACFGFFLWNWPYGKIFLGDGGAYFLGFCTVCLGVLLTSRCSEVSPFAPILLGLYPLIEAVFSMYRRFLLKGHSIARPDAIHLHSLIFRRVLKKQLISGDNTYFLNSKVAYFFWITSVITGSLTCFFYTNTTVLLVLFFIYTFIYIKVFKSLVRFQTPIWLSFFYSVFSVKNRHD